MNEDSIFGRGKIVLIVFQQLHAEQICEFILWYFGSKYGNEENHYMNECATVLGYKLLTL